jgi:hypothetical protein
MVAGCGRSPKTRRGRHGLPWRPMVAHDGSVGAAPVSAVRQGSMTIAPARLAAERHAQQPAHAGVALRSESPQSRGRSSGAHCSAFLALASVKPADSHTSIAAWFAVCGTMTSDLTEAACSTRRVTHAATPAALPRKPAGYCRLAGGTTPSLRPLVTTAPMNYHRGHVRACRNRSLHRSGWSNGEVGTSSGWLVTGTNGESIIRDVGLVSEGVRDPRGRFRRDDPIVTQSSGKRTHQSRVRP